MQERYGECSRIVGLGDEDLVRQRQADEDVECRISNPPCRYKKRKHVVSDMSDAEDADAAVLKRQTEENNMLRRSVHPSSLAVMGKLKVQLPTGRA